LFIGTNCSCFGDCAGRGIGRTFRRSKGGDVTSSVYSRTLQKAAELLGSRQKLARHLRVPLTELEKWIAGAAVPPTGTFLKAVDVVIVETAPPSGGEPSNPDEPPEPRDASGATQSC
jgi:hypothetical protein